MLVYLYECETLEGTKFYSYCPSTGTVVDEQSGSIVHVEKGIICSNWLLAKGLAIEILDIVDIESQNWRLSAWHVE